MTDAIPSDLTETDALMHRYANSVRTRWKQQRCGSAEKNYKHEQIGERESRPKPDTMPEYAWYDLLHTLHKLPEKHQRVLAVIYRIDDNGMQRRWCHGHGIQRAQVWHDHHMAALRMLRNLMRPLTDPRECA